MKFWPLYDRTQTIRNSRQNTEIHPSDEPPNESVRVKGEEEQLQIKPSVYPDFNGVSQFSDAKDTLTSEQILMAKKKDTQTAKMSCVYTIVPCVDVGDFLKGLTIEALSNCLMMMSDDNDNQRLVVLAISWSFLENPKKKEKKSGQHFEMEQSRNTSPE